MKTIKLNLYELDELEEKARANALLNCLHCNVSDDWWRNVYEDAENIGLKLTGFDIDRGNYCNGELLRGATDTAHLIVAGHGDMTDTYQIAVQFLAMANRTLTDDEYFLKSLLRQYLEMLRQEYDFLTSDRGIADTIVGNEWLFTADGKTANHLEKLTAGQSPA